MSYSLRSSSSLADTSMFELVTNSQRHSSVFTMANNNVGLNDDSESEGGETTLDELKAMLKLVIKKQKTLDTIEDTLKTVIAEQEAIKGNVAAINIRVNKLESSDANMEARLNAALKQMQISALVNEHNGKQYNVLIKNLPGSTKETPVQSCEKVRSVLCNALKINDVNAISIANAHRLPSKDNARPTLIFKLRTLFDKQIIWDNIEKLQFYNSTKSDEDKIYFEMNHLPKKNNG